MKRTLITALCFGGGLAPALGQLAFTEAMSAASTSLGAAVVPQMADFWELTNFGTNDIDLTGYKWNDNSGGLVGADDFPFRGLTIATGESILFVQNDPLLPITEQDVRDWWGPCLPSSTRVVFYYGNGFGQGGDGIRLWAAGETDPANVVDRVDFGQARRGRTFTYNPQTGIFGRFSVEGVDGACKAATRDDVGSPGTTTGWVALDIFTQPASVTTCAGVDVTFSVKAGGLPPPKFRWFFNTNEIPGETDSRYTVVNPQATNAGEYWVEVSNGFETRLSEVATLTVSSDPTPPSLYESMGDALALTNETARFSVPVCAFPPPTFQWQTNGVDLPGATNRTLALPNVQLSMSGTVYCVQIQNPLGSTSVCARLTVTPKPDLAIMEVHPAPSTNFAFNADWFELWNYSTFSVNLLGYRWASGNNMPPSLEEPRVVTESAILQPGQCAIFVERLTREQFVQWWGAERLPPGLIVLTYLSEGLDGDGDDLYFWSPGATNPLDYITSIAWAGAANGVSKFFLTNFFDAVDYDSVLGERGAFQAEQSDDIGSPGYLKNPPPRFVRVSRDGTNTSLRWRAVVGHTYVLKWKHRLTDPVWTTLLARTATDWVEEATDSTGAGQRFYRLEVLP